MMRRVFRSRIAIAVASMMVGVVIATGCGSSSKVSVKKPTAVKLNDDPNTKLGCDRFSEIDTLSTENMTPIYNLLSTSHDSKVNLKVRDLWSAMKVHADSLIPSAAEDLTKACNSWKQKKGLLQYAPASNAPTGGSSSDQLKAIAARVESLPLPQGSTEDMTYRFRSADSATYNAPAGFRLDDLKSWYDRQLPFGRNWQSWKWCESSVIEGQPVQRFWIVPGTARTLGLSIGSNSSDGESDAFILTDRTNDPTDTSPCSG